MTATNKRPPGELPSKRPMKVIPVEETVRNAVQGKPAWVVTMISTKPDEARWR